jgi:hypothetical protein
MQSIRGFLMLEQLRRTRELEKEEEESGIARGGKTRCMPG